MSAETKEAMRQAISDHLADEWEGSYLTCWYVVATGESMTNANVTTYMFEHPTDVAPHTWLGLVKMANLNSEVELFSGSSSAHDEDDEDD